MDVLYYCLSSFSAANIPVLYSHNNNYVDGGYIV